MTLSLPLSLLYILVKENSLVEGTPVCLPKAAIPPYRTNVNWQYTDPRINQRTKYESEEIPDMDAHGETQHYSYAMCAYLEFKHNASVKTMRMQGSDHCNFESSWDRIMGKWNAQSVCNNSATFFYFEKTNQPDCKIRDIHHECTKPGSQYTDPLNEVPKSSAVVPARHAAFRDPQDPCPNDFFGVVVEVYATSRVVDQNYDYDTILFVSKNTNGRFNLDELEAAVCKREFGKICLPDFQPLQLLDVNWTYVSPLLVDSERTAFEAEPLEYNSPLKMGSICTGVDRGMVVSETVEIPEGQCSNTANQISGRLKRHHVCGTKGWFYYFLKDTRPACNLTKMSLKCREHNSYKGIATTRHILAADPDDPCPTDFFGYVVEIYQLPTVDVQRAHSIIYASSTQTGRFNIAEINDAVCIKKVFTLPAALTSVAPAQPICTAHRGVCEWYPCCNERHICCARKFFRLNDLSGSDAQYNVAPKCEETCNQNSRINRPLSTFPQKKLAGCRKKAKKPHTKAEQKHARIKT